MPKNLAKSQRAAEKKQKHNSGIEGSAIDDPDALFGRALKSLGNGWFQIAVQDPNRRESLIEAVAAIGGRSVIRIQINDIVVVAQSGKRYELMGSISRKGALHLQSQKRIPKTLLVEGCGEEVEEGVVFDDAEDVNVDAI
jgi:hypothetical protein